jgi:hypothetical protein
MDFSRFKDLPDIIDGNQPRSICPYNQIDFWKIVDEVPELFVKMKKNPDIPYPEESIRTMIDALLFGANKQGIPLIETEIARQKILTRIKELESNRER